MLQASNGVNFGVMSAHYSTGTFAEGKLFSNYAILMVMDVDFEYEDRLRSEIGSELIVGVDEVGRGPLAGPVTAGAFVFVGKVALGDLKGLKDSKQLSAVQRERFYAFFKEWKRQGIVDFATASVTPRTIDKRHIHHAAVRAMRRAVEKLTIRPEYAVIDCVRYGEPILSECPYVTFPKADVLVPSCAAASIVGKVTRDRTMMRYHKQYPQYGFKQHKGYGTATHYEALARFGPTPIHRRSFRLA